MLCGHFQQRTRNSVNLSVQIAIGRLRADLSKDLSSATADVRAKGMSVEASSITSALPKPPQLLTFATKSDTDAAARKEAKQKKVWLEAAIHLKPIHPCHDYDFCRHQGSLQSGYFLM